MKTRWLFTGFMGFVLNSMASVDAEEGICGVCFILNFQIDKRDADTPYLS